MAMDKDDLSELNAIFKDMGGVDKVEDYTNNFEKLPDGNYVGEIEKFETKNSKSSGKRIGSNPPGKQDDTASISDNLICSAICHGSLCLLFPIIPLEYSGSAFMILREA